MNKKYQRLLSFQITPQRFYGCDKLERVVVIVGDMLHKAELTKIGNERNGMFEYKIHKNGAKSWSEFVKKVVMEYDSEGVSVYTGSQKDIHGISLSIKGGKTMNKKQQAIFDKMKESNYNVIKCADKEEANNIADVIGMPILYNRGLNLYLSSVRENTIILEDLSLDKIICTGAEFLAMKDYGEEYVEPNVEEIRFVTNLFENSFNEFKKQLNKPKVLEDAEKLIGKFNSIAKELKEKAIGLNTGKLKKLIKKLEGVLDEK